jgi:hypothetical protein
MDPERILERLRAYEGVDILSTPECEYAYYHPARNIPHDRRIPFATLMRRDVSDAASALERLGGYRVNAGVRRETYRALFGPEPAWGAGGGVVETGHDFTRRDVFLPHPIYAPMSWLCIVSPREASWPQLRAYLDEAHEKAKQALEKRTSGEA